MKTIAIVPMKLNNRRLVDDEGGLVEDRRTDKNKGENEYESSGGDTSENGAWCKLCLIGKDIGL